MYCFFSILQIDSQFDVDEAKKCLYWIGEVTGENIEIQDTDDKREMAHSFYSTLKDGMLICKWVFTDNVPFLPPACVGREITSPSSVCLPVCPSHILTTCFSRRHTFSLSLRVEPCTTVALSSSLHEMLRCCKCFAVF